VLAGGRRQLLLQRKDAGCAGQGLNLHRERRERSQVDQRQGAQEDPGDEAIALGRRCLAAAVYRLALSGARAVVSGAMGGATGPMCPRPPRPGAISPPLQVMTQRLIPRSTSGPGRRMSLER
jgi:hypothetical protein